MKKAFSLLEIIFAITVMALIASFIVKNSSTVLEKATLTKTKTEISLIRHALNMNKNSRIQLGLSPYPSSLDSAKNNTPNELLFAGNNEQRLLLHPLIATTTFEKEVGSFAKISSKTYYLYVNNNEFIKFEYDKNEGTFNCDNTNNLCKELE